VSAGANLFGSLMKAFGPRRDTVRGECKRLRIEEIHGRFFSPNFIRVIKSRRMKWGRGVKGEKRQL
jgi:hypothetical protein